MLHGGQQISSLGFRTRREIFVNEQVKTQRKSVGIFNSAYPTTEAFALPFPQDKQ